MLIAIIWGVIVSNLVTETQVYNDCKNTKCVVVIKDIGYKIEVSK